jgi:hypothetical protein
LAGLQSFKHKPAMCSNHILPPLVEKIKPRTVRSNILREALESRAGMVLDFIHLAIVGQFQALRFHSCVGSKGLRLKFVLR